MGDYYFVDEYEIDSAQYVLVNGKVRLDSLNVDVEANLDIRELKQLVRVEGWTQASIQNWRHWSWGRRPKFYQPGAGHVSQSYTGPWRKV